MAGMNAAVISWAIALQCQLNDTLYNLQNVGSSPLNGASFYSTNVSTASAHMIAGHLAGYGPLYGTNLKASCSTLNRSVKNFSNTESNWKKMG